MIRRAYFLFLSFLIMGCASSASAPYQNITKTELKYKKILVLPFTDSDQATKVKAESIFLDALKTYPDLTALSAQDAGQNIWTDMGIENPSKYSVIDFSVSPQGYDRRKKIQDNWGAKAIVLGSIMKKEHTLSMYIQMIDAEDGELTLSFSKIENFGDLEEEALEKLSKDCADKVIRHIKDNVVVTTIRKY